VCPVLLYYPELQGLSPTRSAQYETAVKTENPARYLYDFYLKYGRGLVPAPIEGEAEPNRFPDRGKLVLTGCQANNSLAEVAAVGACQISVSAVGRISTFAFLSFRVAVVGFLAVSAGCFAGFF